MKDDWDPTLYLKFRAERTQPSKDLVARIEVDNPQDIIDIGCGPGNSTRVLRERWPKARIVGLDRSEAMLEEAREGYPQGEWVRGDASDLEKGRGYDVVFSNAVIQWVPDHRRLIPSMMAMVKEGGALAVQIPSVKYAPLHHLMVELGRDERYRDHTRGCDELLEFHDADIYYDLLSPTSRRMEMWETIYYHELRDHEDLIEWYRATGMKPYLESIPDEPTKRAFAQDLLALARRTFPKQGNGRVIYPFRRLFFIAYR